MTSQQCIKNMEKERKKKEELKRRRKEREDRKALAESNKKVCFQKKTGIYM